MADIWHQRSALANADSSSTKGGRRPKLLSDDSEEADCTTWCPTVGMARLNISPRPRKRAQSMKKSPKHKLLENVDLDEMRPRTSSLPTRNSLRKPRTQYLSPFGSYTDESEFYTLRSFVTTPKGGLVNRGDSLRSRSSNSVMSSNSGSATELTPLSRTSSSASQGSLSPGHCPLRVLVLGSPGVGKTSIIMQFMTSEYMGGHDASIDGESHQTVSVLLDGEESMVDFVEVKPEESCLEEGADGYVLVFSVDTRATFEAAVDRLYELRQSQGKHTAAILVANKVDLVRRREVSTDEAKSVAISYDVKYAEISVVLNHNVDELLVGMVTQIRLKAKAKRREQEEGTSCYSRSKTLLTKIFKKENLSKSCENLYGP